MRTLITILVFLLGFHASANTIELDILKVMKQAYAANPDLEIARARLEHAQKSAEAAYRKFSLKLDLNTSAVREDMPSYFLAKTADSRQLDMMTTDLNNPGTNTHYETGIDLFYPLFYRGLKKLTRSFADIDKEIAENEYNTYSNKIISAAISLYYGYRIAYEQQLTESESLARVKRQLTEIEIKYRGGSILKTDLLGMQVRVKETEMRLISAENNCRIALSALLNFLGYADNTEIRIIDKDWDIKTLPETFEESLDEAFNNRYELAIAELSKRKAAQGVKMAASTQKPEAYIFGRAAFNDDSLTLSSDRDSYMLGIKLSVNLWDNKLTTAEKEAAQIKQKEADRYSKKIHGDIELDVRTTFENVNSAKATVSVSSARVELARENLSLMKKQYEGGTITITSFLDAEQAYSNALLGNIAARYQLLMAKAELGRALGYCIMCVENN